MMLSIAIPPAVNWCRYHLTETRPQATTTCGSSREFRESQRELTQCAGYVHWRSSPEATGAILFLHGMSEAATCNGEAQQGPIRLLRHPLPAYFCMPEELAEVEGWRPNDNVWGLPPSDLCERWQRYFELFAPQKRQAGS